MNRMASASRDQILRRTGLAGSVLSAVGASICCIGPVAAALLGAGSLGALLRFAPLRPYLLAVTLALLAGAFYLTYRKKPAEVCAPDSLCATHGADRIDKLNRIVLWVVIVVVLAVLTFPTWSNWILG